MMNPKLNKQLTQILDSKGVNGVTTAIVHALYEISDDCDSTTFEGRCKGIRLGELAVFIEVGTYQEPH